MTDKLSTALISSGHFSNCVATMRTALAEVAAICQTHSFDLAKVVAAIRHPRVAGEQEIYTT